MWILGGQGVAGLFPQGLVHPADELAVRSLGCNGPDGFKIKDFHVFSLSIFIFLLSYKPPGFRRRASGFIDRALRRRGCGHPPSADAAFPGRLQSWPAPPQRCGRSSLGGLVRPLVHVRRLHGRVVQPPLPRICGLTCADIIAEYFGNFNGFVVDPHAQSAELQHMLGK